MKANTNMRKKTEKSPTTRNDPPGRMKFRCFLKRYRWFLLPISAVLVALVLNLFVIVNAYIPSESMSPTFNKGACIFGNRLAYLSHGPERGDIIIFRHPEFGKKLLIKRVAAIGGDTVAIKNETVFINGEAVTENYSFGKTVGELEEVTVPKGSVLVLGDNRVNSNDSRFWDYPFVDNDDIVAKAFFEYFPKWKKLT